MGEAEFGWDRDPSSFEKELLCTIESGAEVKNCCENVEKEKLYPVEKSNVRDNMDKILVFCCVGLIYNSSKESASTESIHFEYVAWFW